MNTWIIRIVTIAFLLGGVLLLPASVQAASASASVNATVISPSVVAIVAAAELLQSTSVGELTLNIPGAGASSRASSTGNGAAAGGMALTSTGVVGNTIFFSTVDAASLATIVSTLATSGGSFGTNGILSTGQVVHLVITQIVQGGNGTGTVYAVVSYN